MRNHPVENTFEGLKLQSADYGQIFRKSSVCYMILSVDGMILNANNACLKQLGVEKNGIVGRHVTHFLSQHVQQQALANYFDRILTDKKSTALECDFNKSDGSSFPVQIESSLIHTSKDKSSNYFFTTIRDISIQKHQEHQLEIALLRERELNQLKSQFVSIASHEFRTPLSTILTSAELMEHYEKPGEFEKRKTHLHKITSSVNRIREILIDFLSAEEIESGTLRNKPVNFDLVDFTQAVIRDTNTMNGSHQVFYEHEGEFRNAYLDRKLLTTVVRNLLHNAYKYSPKGSKIEIRTQQLKSGEILIWVKDEGIGIPKSQEKHIFEQFFRASNAGKTAGTGIGLHIAKKILNLMGGHIFFLSEENKGSTFFVKF